jgi:5'-methylthioadenosine phosphorylase
VDALVKVLFENADKARALVREMVPLLAAARGPCAGGCDRALEYAVITAPEKRDAALMAKLDVVAGRVLGQ